MIREMVYSAVRDDPELAALFGSAQLLSDALYAYAASDTPPQRRWITLVWGIEDQPLGRDTTARNRRMAVWAYDKDMAYGWIDEALSVVGRIISGLEGAVGDHGSIIGVDPEGMSEDLVDDAYSAATRNKTFRFALSGR